MDIILYSLKIYNKIIIRLKTNKYKMNIAYYLFFLSLSLAIKRNHQAYWFILKISKFLYYKICYHFLNMVILLGFWLFL